MSILVSCKCGERLRAENAAAGRTANCPKCGQSIEIPEPLVEQETVRQEPAVIVLPSEALLSTVGTTATVLGVLLGGLGGYIVGILTVFLTGGRNPLQFVLGLSVSNSEFESALFAVPLLFGGILGCIMAFAIARSSVDKVYKRYLTPKDPNNPAELNSLILLLSHDRPGVRRATCLVIQEIGEKAVPALPYLVPTSWKRIKVRKNYCIEHAL